MRKKFALALALALTLSLAACNKPAAETDPAETVVPEQTQTQDTPEAENVPLKETGTAEPVKIQELTEAELHTLFEEVYLDSVFNMRNNLGVSLDTLLSTEMSGVKFAVSNYSQLPSDWRDQYKTWRESYQIKDLSYVFTDQEQTMYAVKDADACSGIYESDNVVCGFKAGQAVQVTGFGYDEAAGWAKIAFEGDEAYVSLNYLSDKKPSTQSTQQTQAQQNNGGQTNGGQTQQNNGGGYNGTGLTFDEIAKLPDSEKIDLGFHQLSDGSWVDSKHRMLPGPEISQEAHEQTVQNIIDAGIIIGSG